MNGIIFGVAGLAVGLLVALLLKSSTKKASTTEAPTGVALTAADIERVVKSQFAEALTDLTERAREDRNESINLAATQVAKSGGDELGKRAEEIDNTLKTYREAIDKQVSELQGELKNLRDMNIERFGSVDTAVNGLAFQTQALNKVLSSSQGRGNWGERMLEDILTQSGFERGINYERQEKLEGGGKPDYSFFLPPDRVLYLDSKFPLENYLKYFEASDENSQKMYKESFLKNVEQRVKELEDRDYVEQSNKNAIDYVLLFIPNEGILGFIQNERPSLIDDAINKKVLLCSPLTLYAFLGVVRQASSSFNMAQEANEVLRLLTSFGKAWTHYVNNLNDIYKSFEKMQKKLKAVTTGRVFGTLRKSVEQVESLAQSKGIGGDTKALDEMVAAFETVEQSGDSDYELDDE